MPPDTFPIRLGCLPFLKHTCHLPAAQPVAPVYVLGNTSADLDSIISAIIYSYFSTVQPRHEQHNAPVTRPHVPVINLPDVPAGTELRRLRPEFATALSLSTRVRSSSKRHSPSLKEDDEEEAQLLTEHVLTVADLRSQLQQFPRSDADAKLALDITMVDWNALPIKSKDVPGRGSTKGLEDIADLSVIGCIDHHEDESFVPRVEDLSDGQPRTIQRGPGSCTSLVVRELRNWGLWPDQDQALCGGEGLGVTKENEAQAAKLALAAILIDTTNLTAEGKVTDVDRAAVAFLETKVQQATSDSDWDRNAFFEKIQCAKQHSLDLLAVDEILGRDYKEWTEKSSGRSTKIGIVSVVRPISWIAVKAQKESQKDVSSESVHINAFLERVRSFSKLRELDVVAIMTAFTDTDDGSFHRELLVWALEEVNVKSVGRFATHAAKELGLDQYEDSIHGVCEDREGQGKLYIWRQTNLAQSRKQVAPLLRSVF